MEMKLVSMTDFILSQSEKYLNGFITLTEFHKYTLNYANFLKQPLTLGMFVPVKDDEVMIKPKISNYDKEELEASVMGVDVVNFNEAKSKVLFQDFFTSEIYPPSKSFELIQEDKKNQICIYKDRPDYFIWNYKTIEELTEKKLVITQTAINQIF